MQVIARAYGDEPLERIAVGVARKVVYIASASALEATEMGNETGVGFPVDCVFEFDSTLIRALKVAWNTGDESELSRLWSMARPFQS